MVSAQVGRLGHLVQRDGFSVAALQIPRDFEDASSFALGRPRAMHSLGTIRPHPEVLGARPEYDRAPARRDTTGPRRIVEFTIHDRSNAGVRVTPIEGGNPLARAKNSLAYAVDGGARRQDGAVHFDAKHRSGSREALRMAWGESAIFPKFPDGATAMLGMFRSAEKRMLRAGLVQKLVTAPELGINLLGFSTVCFGIACFLQRDFTLYWQPVPDNFPFRQPLALLSAALLVFSGIALWFARTRRHAAILQVCLFLAYAASWLSKPITAGSIQPFLGIAEHLAIVVGAATVWARVSPSTAKRFTPAMARMLYGCCSIVFGVAHVMALDGTAGLIPSWFPGSGVFWALFTGAAHLAVGFALIADRWAFAATRWAGFMYFCFAAIVWMPGAVTHPDQWLRWAGEAISLAMLAAVWLVGDYLQPHELTRSWMARQCLTSAGRDST
jgi:uncharacterized membrane protein